MAASAYRLLVPEIQILSLSSSLFFTDCYALKRYKESSSRPPLKFETTTTYHTNDSLHSVKGTRANTTNSLNNEIHYNHSGDLA